MPRNDDRRCKRAKLAKRAKQRTRDLWLSCSNLAKSPRVGGTYVGVCQTLRNFHYFHTILSFFSNFEASFAVLFNRRTEPRRIHFLYDHYTTRDTLPNDRAFALDFLSRESAILFTTVTNCCSRLAAKTGTVHPPVVYEIHAALLRFSLSCSNWNGSSEKFSTRAKRTDLRYGKESYSTCYSSPWVRSVS